MDGNLSIPRTNNLNHIFKIRPLMDGNLIYKLIKDINALIIKIETQKTEIKNLKDDIKQLSECLHDLKLKFIK